MKRAGIERVVKKSSVRKLLLGYAYKLVSSPLLSWPGECDLRELAEDMVSDAICKTITGDRTWEPANSISENGLMSEADEKSLIASLLGSIKSIATNRQRNDENKLRKVPLDVPQAEMRAASQPSAQEQLEADAFFYGLLEELGDDEVCCRIAGLCYDQRRNPDEVVAEMDLTDSERYAANKRLKRKTRAYLQKLRAGS